MVVQMLILGKVSAGLRLQQLGLEAFAIQGALAAGGDWGTAITGLGARKMPPLLQKLQHIACGPSPQPLTPSLVSHRLLAAPYRGFMHALCGAMNEPVWRQAP